MYIVDVLTEIFEKLPGLAVLYFQNNPAIKNIKNYRKSLVNSIKTLKYLDDKPVFPEERSIPIITNKKDSVKLSL